MCYNKQTAHCMLYNNCFVEIILILNNLNYGSNVAISIRDVEKLCASRVSSCQA